MIKRTNDKSDKRGYNEHYAGRYSKLSSVSDPQEYIQAFEKRLKPYYLGGLTKGYVRGLATSVFLQEAERSGKNYHDIRVLDAGCGLGELSVYLACKGFNVLGVDISKQACTGAEYLARSMDVQERCVFLPESLEDTKVPDSSIDYIIGHASLHHFIKYSGVSAEFNRILKRSGKGFFADSYGENKLYHLFHDKKKMKKLGDITLTKKMILSFFSEFDVSITPTDWLVMLDKLYLNLLPRKFDSILKGISRLHFWVDRKIPKTPRLALFCSGSVMTIIIKKW